MKYRPMRHIQPETGEYIVSVFKRLIQLYVFCLFLYSLTYCIKEALNEKSAGLRGSYGPRQGNPLQYFSNNNPIVFVLFFLYSMTSFIKEVIKGNIFGDQI